MITLLLLLIVAVISWLNIKATMLVLGDALSEPRQRVLQLALVWLLPLLGAIVVLAVHRPGEKPSGAYREPRGISEDLGVWWRGGRGQSDASDGD